MWHKVTSEFLSNQPDWFDGFLWVRYLDTVYFGKYTWTQGRNPDKFLCWFEDGLCEIDAFDCYVQQAIEPVFNDAQKHLTKKLTRKAHYQWTCISG